MPFATWRTDQYRGLSRHPQNSSRLVCSYGDIDAMVQLSERERFLPVIRLAKVARAQFRVCEQRLGTVVQDHFPRL